MGVAVVLLIPRGGWEWAQRTGMLAKAPEAVQEVKYEGEERGRWISMPWVTGTLKGTGRVEQGRSILIFPFWKSASMVGWGLDWRGRGAGRTTSSMVPRFEQDMAVA